MVYFLGFRSADKGIKEVSADSVWSI